jgi:dCTP deaminase
MVLGKSEILRLIENFSANDRRGLVITPLLDRDGVFGDDSVDLRLGCYFLLPKMQDQPFFSPDRRSTTSLHVKIHVPLGHYLVIPAHQTVLGATLEFIKLPYDVSGQVLTKSSVARTFVVVETAPWVHPRYRGCLTLEIANVSNTPVLLYPGRTICQLVLMRNLTAEKRTNGAPRNLHQKPSRKTAPNYFGPVYPEAPKFKNPQDDLRQVGVARISRLRQTRMIWRGRSWDEQLVDTDEGQ